MKRFFVPLFSFILLGVSGSGYTLLQSTGVFTGYTHIGNPEKSGAFNYSISEQVYTLEGASGNMWFDHDDFHFIWKKVKGDFILEATVEFVGKGVEPHRKVGWMVRQNLDANSPHINAVVHGDGLTSLQYRKVIGGMTEEVTTEIVAPTQLKLERKGNLYKMSAARMGEPFVTAEYSELVLSDEVYIGLFLCSHNETAIEKGIFRDVKITVAKK
ncbi:DUF1349 domain-containing protein [Ohtaekwangia koreensis]|uniref:Regulation of enolase protein 1, concanavalin A-like superfamily n=1 Tax=Ohtaekwangia koreensis TaxID=688867 RepID=A0A1T5JV71_9BACT|nr:hypothetical protein [Ohtaekwangia koreensis]SKC55260.1 Regulation of enolase protein 1, concanavalin A-like superfamily [Ohtaekwangia koreensis]